MNDVISLPVGLAIDTKEHPGPYDGFEKAEPEEPIFTLIASDPHAPKTIRFWVDLKRKDARKIKDDKERAEKLKQCTNAEFVSFEFDRWRKGQPEHDTITPARATYSGITKTETEEVKRKRLVDQSSKFLREAAYNFCCSMEILAEIGEFGDSEAEAMKSTLDLINKYADKYTPKRPDFRAKD